MPKFLLVWAIYQRKKVSINENALSNTGKKLKFCDELKCRSKILNWISSHPANRIPTILLKESLKKKLLLLLYMS
jgi:hypothetical protein